MKKPDKLFLVIDKMINPDHEKQEDFNNSRFVAEINHEKELAKLNGWEYFVIKVLPFLISGAIIIILIKSL